MEMLEHLSLKLPASPHFTLQAVITKADAVPPEEIMKSIEGIRKQVREAAPLCLPPIVTSTKMSPPYGIEKMRESIIEACGLGGKVKVKIQR
jgi:GTP-binding protein